MPLINYIEANGNHHEIEVASGDSIMQGAVDNMIDAILAECGGACACATCHCYVDESCIDKVPAATELEKDLLEAVLEPRDNSRLSCQLVVTDDMEGFTVHLPESQY
ncbi:MAG: 2Fe-2S iron-sulfur cluster binding domain-containing protein [Gammaproteobacteria bacterium]|uniref:2Fe-2S iron-sulfur cluster-binding protein n=1 Tax=Pseudomaricurvus alcaniphilus TaxID=1166482 RepID=UPI00140C2A04|nr:2Fe-2S iron-sulfur cluster-binding protein [Pseudomaricurvus alcaniphilus]MBR9910368.1 2Fe-2S iron-sulfur cluster binding domain-containing protein [Gammaproteobacteria bacterium]NHN36221.1 2Fe-2S iron-sulfur cluster binding domain-containing protein [Pseudomaricurvus alcaniphilus]